MLLVGDTAASNDTDLNTHDFPLLYHSMPLNLRKASMLFSMLAN